MSMMRQFVFRNVVDVSSLGTLREHVRNRSDGYSLYNIYILMTDAICSEKMKFKEVLITCFVKGISEISKLAKSKSGNFRISRGISEVFPFY